MATGMGIDISQAREFAIDGAMSKKAIALKGNGSAAVTRESANKTATDFESMFLEQMFNHMFSTIPVNSTFGGGQAEETMRSFLTGAYAKQMVKAGGIGLAPHIASEILKIQEKADGIAR
jgi:peptidoglycan hydrolase FlgJ